MMYLVLFFFNDTATTEIYTLSLHDALPISGFVALVFTNASRAMPPWGGREALLGTSPLAAGAPGGKLAPFVLDMSDRKSTRLNSSHGYTSYSVFFLKKKKKIHNSRS